MTDIGEIVELIGIEATTALILHQRGQRLYVPQRVAPHILETVVGHSAFLKLVDAFAGSTLHLPLGEGAVYRRCRTRAFDLLAAGLSQEAIAVRLGVSRRTVQRWFKASPSGDTQFLLNL